MHWCQQQLSVDSLQVVSWPHLRCVMWVTEVTSLARTGVQISTWLHRLQCRSLLIVLAISYTIYRYSMSCSRCLYTMHAFCTIAADVDQLLCFLFLHHVLLECLWCDSCGGRCYLDRSKFVFRCDCLHVEYDARTRHRKTWRCRFSKSLFKGTWFERSHLPVSQ